MRTRDGKPKLYLIHETRKSLIQWVFFYPCIPMGIKFDLKEGLLVKVQIWKKLRRFQLQEPSSFNRVFSDKKPSCFSEAKNQYLIHGVLIVEI